MKVKEHYMYLYPAGTILELTEVFGDKPAGVGFEVVDTDEMGHLHGVWLPPYQGSIVIRADDKRIRKVGDGMEKKKEEVRICPRCGQTYCDYPATSRADGKTQICPDCGIMEALESVGASEERKREVIETVHKYSPKGKI